jgi:hypothetical protein
MLITLLLLNSHSVLVRKSNGAFSFAVVPQLPVIALHSAILSMSRQESDRKLLHNIHIPKPVKADYQRDYFPIKKFILDKYLW